MSLKDDPEWKEFKHNWAMSEIYKVIGFFFLVILLIAIKCDSANAQSARITFSSAWDLERQVNEIVAKCDTTWIKTGVIWMPSGIEDTMRIITYRKLVTVAVTKPLKLVAYKHWSGGQAVVWWEKARR